MTLMHKKNMSYKLERVELDALLEVLKNTRRAMSRLEDEDEVPMTNTAVVINPKWLRVSKNFLGT